MRIATLLGGLLAVLLLAFGLPSGDGGVRAGTAVRMDVAELVESADLVLEGRILSTAVVEAEGRIETEYLLEVERTFEGRDLPHRAVRFPGGVRADGSGMMLAGMPRLAGGEEVLLFLSQEGPSGVRMPVGLAQGKLRIVRAADGTKRLVRDLGGVALVSPGSGTVTHADGVAVRDYAEVVARIEAALARKRAK